MNKLSIRMNNMEMGILKVSISEYLNDFTSAALVSTENITDKQLMTAQKMKDFKGKLNQLQKASDIKTINFSLNDYARYGIVLYQLWERVSKLLNASNDSFTYKVRQNFQRLSNNLTYNYKLIDPNRNNGNFFRKTFYISPLMAHC